MARNDIAIVGMGCVIPGAVGPDQLWENVLGGKSYFSEVPAKLWRYDSFTSPDKKAANKSYTRIGGFLPDFEFPFLDYRLPPKILDQSDRAQLVTMEAARQALLDAGIDAHDPILDRGVTIVGVIGVDGYAHGSAYLRRHEFGEDLRGRLREQGVPEATLATLMDQFGETLKEWGHFLDPVHGAVGQIESSVSNRVAQVFGVRGFNLTIDAACAGGLVAMEMGAQALMAGDADVAVVGGVDLGTGPAIYVGFSRVGGLSERGVASPFDQSADGLVIGEGAGMVVLKRLEDALADGDRIHAVIRGTGSSSDGAGTAIYTPSKEGRKEALVAALENAETDPAEVQFMECHATSTVVGDANEYDAIGEVYGSGRRGDRPPLKLGSIKYQIGHLKGAAGVIGVIKTVRAMEAETFPHMPLFRELTHEAHYRGTDLEIPTTPSHWPLDANGRRVAAVTASGFGGINYQVILERADRYDPPKQRPVVERDVAIVGVACRVPGATTREEFWENLRSGKELFTAADPTELKWDHLTEVIDVERVARLADWDLNSPKFRIFPNAVSQIAPTQFLALDLTDRLLAQAGLHGKGPKNISACIGAIHNDHFGDIFEPMMRDEYSAAIRACSAASDIDAGVLETALRATSDWIVETRPPVTEHTLPGWMGNCISGRMSKAFDLHGPNFIVDTACSSGLAAMMAAMYQVMFGKAEAVISGGLNLCIGPELAYGECCIGATAKHTARPFDAESDGFLQGEGGVFFLLKKLADARRDGDEILAIIRGVGGASEADSRSMLAPSELSVRRAIRRTLEQAPIDVLDIGVVDTHGSGNALADIVEARSIAAELRPEGTTDPAECVSITAIKSHVGHLFGAAACSGLLSVISSLHAGEAPAIRNLRRVRREVDELGDRVRPIQRNTPLAERVHAGAVSSLGLGGANYFMVVDVPEEIRHRPRDPARRPTRPPTPHHHEGRFIMQSETQPGSATVGRREAPAAGGVFLATAADERALARVLADTLALAHLPETAGEVGAPLRMAVSFDSGETLRAKLELAAAQLGRGLSLSLLEARGIFTHDLGKPSGKLAFCFSGQGNQYPGMARNLYMRDGTFKAVVETLDGMSRELLGFSIVEALYDERNEDGRALGGLEGSQATIFAVEIGLARVLERMGVVPDILIGHSFGEFAALAFAEVWSLEDAFRAVVARVRATQQVVASRPLGMMSVNAGTEVRDGLLAMAGDKVTLCNTNAPGRYVLGGEEAAIRKAFAMAEIGGIDATILPIAAAFHSSFMEPGRAPLHRDLAALTAKPPRIPVLSTVDGHMIEANGFSSASLCERLARQLVSPLDFPTQVHALYRLGVRDFVEVGPKWSVTKMVEAILGDADYRATPTLHPKVGDEETFRRAQALLVALGRVDLRAAEAHREHGIEAGFHAYLREYEPEMLPLLDAAFARFARRRPRHQDDLPHAVSAAFAGSAASSPTTSNPRVGTATTAVRVEPPVALAASAVSGVDGTAVWRDRLRAKLVERTGYPAEMLESELDLEADLGIDSVQRAEIWSSLLVEHGLPEDLQPKGARTISALAGWLAEAAGDTRGVAVETAPTAPATAAVVVSPAPVAASLRVWEDRLRAKLVERTGYPAEMLESGLDLEADLGIDSVQRAEIWALLIDENGLPEDLQPKGARSIAALAGFLAQAAGASASAPAPSNEEPAAATSPKPASTPAVTDGASTSPASTGLWEDRLRAKLVERTGYPAEMLESGLDLEADLGIDSVQRAEIWSLLVEEHGLPEDLQPKGARSIAELARFLAEGSAGNLPAAGAANDPTPAAGGHVHVSAANAGPFPGADEACGLFVVTSVLPEAKNVRRFECRRVLVIGGGRGAKSVRKAIESAGVCVEAVTVDKLRKATPETVEAWVSGCDTVLYAAHDQLTRGELGKGADKRLREATQELFDSFRALVPALEKAPRRVMVPVSQDGAFGATNASTRRPFGSFPAGFVRSMQRELPECPFQLVDTDGLAWEPVVVGALHELRSQLESGPTGSSPVPAMMPAALDDYGYPVGAGDLVFVTGGARGIVFECAFGLARATGCKLVFTGRTPMIEGAPPWLETAPERIDEIVRQLEIGWVRTEKMTMRDAKQQGRTTRAQWEISRNLRRLADAGIEGTYLACDVSDARALASAIAATQARGPIRGVIHGAGVQKSLRLADLDDREVFTTYDTKLVPALAMLELLDWSAMHFLIGFGSVAGLFGNSGQTHYALANDVMTCLIRHVVELHPHVQAQTIQWTAWKGAGMVTAEQAKRFAEGGLVLLDIEEGVRKFLTTLSHGREHRELAVFNASSELAAVRPIVSGFKRSRLVSARNGVPTRRARFSLDRDTYLHQHLVAGNPVVPGTFIAEMMAEICDGHTRVLRNVTFRRPLWVRDEGFEIEFVHDDGRIAVLPLRRRDMPKTALANLEFANCRVAGSDEPATWRAAPLDESVVHALRSSVDAAPPEFYRILDQRFREVLDTGAIFRGVTSMTEASGVFYGLVRLTDEAMGAFEISGGFRFNPVMADMAVQVAAAHGVLNRGVLAIPHSIDRLYIGDSSREREAIVRCEPRESADDGASLDVSIYGLEGNLLLGFEGLTLRTLPREA